MHVFENFLPTWLHKKVSEQLLSPYLDWHFPGSGGPETDINKSSFAKQPFSLDSNVNDFHQTDSLIYALDYWLEENKDIFKINHLHRCMINFYTPGQNTGWHYDMDKENYYSLLYYVNDSDGGTEFKDKRYMHKENKALFFDGRLMHSPITSTSPRRISVNWLLCGELL